MCRGEGKKYEMAHQWGVQVVNSRFLAHIIHEGEPPPVLSALYTSLDQPDEFSSDSSTNAAHLLGQCDKEDFILPVVSYSSLPDLPSSNSSIDKFLFVFCLDTWRVFMEQYSHTHHMSLLADPLAAAAVGQLDSAQHSRKRRRSIRMDRSYDNAEEPSVRFVFEGMNHCCSFKTVCVSLV